MDAPAFTVHPTANVSKDASIGDGTRIWNQAQVRENAYIGRNCIIGKDVYIDFSVKIGDNVKIQNGVLVYHGITIESGVFVGPGVIFTNDKRPRAINPDGTIKGNDDWDVGVTRVCYGASVGAGAVILPNLTIGTFALIAAGAVVTYDVPPHALVVGNPARQVGYVCKCAAKLIDDGNDMFHCPACNEQYIFQQGFEVAK